MSGRELAGIRKLMGKSQRDLARLLGLSIKAIHSYEQGWRGIPDGVERQVLFLLSRHRDFKQPTKACWVIKGCSPEQRQRCPAWEFRCGHLCWFICGTICQGQAQKNWQEKIKICRKCEVFSPLFVEFLKVVDQDSPQVQPESQITPPQQ
ncbi:MAG: helix-turn-helix transcriptional regulator [Deltaproteobacteria bacterium]|nr:helix-turn-helix transcriptional regulator [Deltaproteobacteria bacterium]